MDDKFMQDFMDEIFGKPVAPRPEAAPRLQPAILRPVVRPVEKPRPVDVKNQGWGPSATVWLEGNMICCQSSYKPESIPDVREIVGRRWDVARKLNTFPLVSAPQVIRWVNKWYPATDCTILTGASARLDVQIRNGFFLVRTPYAEAFVARIKGMPTVSYHLESKTWNVPVDRAGALREHLLACYGTSAKVVDEAIAEQEKMRELATAVKSEDRLVLPGGELFPYQVSGVKFLTNNGKGIIADEMGLGKTLQAIAYLNENRKDCLPCLVICPARLKTNWEREVRKWLGDALTVKVLGGPKRKGQTDIPDADVNVVNYENAGKLLADGTGKPLYALKSVVLDECHYVKNPKSQRSRAVASLGKSVGGRIVMLSGTPMLNRPEELWNLLHMLDAPAWGTLSKYKWRYCGPKKTYFGVEYEGASNLAELHDRLLGHYMVRRLKKDVLKDLPEKIRSFVPVELSSKDTKDYMATVTSFASKFEEAGAKLEKVSYANVLAMMTALRHEVGLKKVPLAVAWVQEALENTDKVLVFAHHHDVIDGVLEGLAAEGIRCGVIDGRESLKSGQAAVDGFQAGDTQVLVCGIMAAGVGLTLTAADQVLFVERVWRPSDHDQAEDRTHRIGQKRCVNVWFFDAVGTIDEELRAVQEGKRSVIKQSIDGRDIDEEDVEKSVVLEVARRILNSVKGGSK